MGNTFFVITLFLPMLVLPCSLLSVKVCAFCTLPMSGRHPYQFCPGCYQPFSYFQVYKDLKSCLWIQVGQVQMQEIPQT